MEVADKPTLSSTCRNCCALIPYVPASSTSRKPSALTRARVPGTSVLKASRKLYSCTPSGPWKSPLSLSSAGAEADAFDDGALESLTAASRAAELQPNADVRATARKTLETATILRCTLSPVAKGSADQAIRT